MSPADDARIELARIHERVGMLDQKANAGHQRIDQLERLIREDLKALMFKIDVIDAWMNRSKGWAAAALLLWGGLVGAGLFKLLGKFF